MTPAEYEVRLADLHSSVDRDLDRMFRMRGEVESVVSGYR